MKLAAILLILYIAMVGIMIFDDTSNRSGFSINPYGAEDNAELSDSEAMWRVFFNPLEWESNILILAIITTAIGIGAVAAFFTKSDISLLFPIFGIILLAGILPIVNIYQVLNRELAGAICPATDATNCSLSILLMGLIMGPITLYWLWSCVDWWTQRQST